MVELSAGERTYFFYLFLAYVGLQGALAAVAALHFPAKDDLEETDSADGYLVRLGLLGDAVLCCAALHC